MHGVEHNEPAHHPTHRKPTTSAQSALGVPGYQMVTILVIDATPLGYSRAMRPSRLAVVATIMASACGSSGVEPLLTCEAGPVFQSTVESCELVVDGTGGAKSALQWTIEIEDQIPWRSYELASDGGVFVFAYDQLTAIVARLGPSGELRWSRSLAFDVGVPDDPASAQIEASATGPEGLHVVAQRRFNPGPQKQYDASTLIHLSETGLCGSPVALAFGGQYQGAVGNMVREPDRLVLTGSHSETGLSRGFVQRRLLAGELVREVEIDDEHDDVKTPYVQVGGPEHYVVGYSGYAPSGIPGSYSSGQLFDESLTSIDQSGGKYISDAFGRLYTWSSNATAGDPLTTPPTEPLPPTLYRVTRSQTPVAPAGETLEIEVPQPLCGWAKLAVFDESLLVLKCSAPDSLSLLLTYDGSGPSDSATTLGCADADVALGPFGFDEDRRLWMSVGPADDNHIISVEF
jgi:hypothetical protein